MPFFFFDFYDNDIHSVDQEGLYLDCAEEVPREATMALKQALFLDGRDGGSVTITCHVRDDVGDVVFRTSVELMSGWQPAKACEQITHAPRPARTSSPSRMT